MCLFGHTVGVSLDKACINHRSDRMQGEDGAEVGKSGRELWKVFSEYTSQVKRSSSVLRFDPKTMNIWGTK